MLDRCLRLLVNELGRQLKDEFMDLDKLEKITSEIICCDELDQLPQYIQDEIYYIDNHDIEDIKIADLKKSQTIFVEFLNSGALSIK